jgi:hypothetical protein
MDISRNKDRNKHGGQTVIETILMLFFLLVLFFLIAEFARAWYLKNSLNNAARVGVRVAVVTPDLSGSGPTSCTSAIGPVYEAVCSSPGLPDTTRVGLFIEDDVGPPAPPASSGDTIKVAIEADFETFVPAVVPALKDISVFAEASMRYE